MTIHVIAKPGETKGHLSFEGRELTCALGRSGLILQAAKREGDGATPMGAWPLRRLLYRADKMDPPLTALASAPINRHDGWCDEPNDPSYNCPIRLPYGASAESLWRDDDLYDMIVVLGHNDAPVIANKGSAIFLHVAKQDSNGLAATEGCVALEKETLRKILEFCSNDTIMEITAAA